MSCRLPGGLVTPQQLWDFIIDKGDARSRVPKSRYNVDAFHSHIAKPGAVRTEYGYFLDDTVDLGALDTSFFSMQRADLEATDPQERLMLELTRECIEDAGVTDWHGRNIGCYIGNFGEDWLEISNKESQRWGGYKTADFMISNPLVGGSNLIMTPSLTSLLSTQEVLSKDGSCKTFSADADGYGRGEALVAVYIKPLQSALRDGNPIRAVIRATGTNHDGKTQGIFQPSTGAQEALIRHTYQSAAISDFGETAMVECHGTGTPTGDPIEAKAVARVFGQTGVYIGSVKPNVGHSEGASGLTSLIKMVLALEHRTIPPNIKFKTPNPNIPFDEGNLVVPIDPIPWPQGRLERVSINCFGVGGTNAHAMPSPVTSPQLLLYSATTSKSLVTFSNHIGKTTWNYQSYLPRYPWNHEETYWAESRLSKDWRFRKHKYHNLLGVRVPESTDLEPAWRNLLHIQNVPWMRDHRVGDNIVFPFTGYLSIAGEAIRQVSGEEHGYSVRDISVDIAMVVVEGSTTEVVTTLRPHYLSKSQESNWWDFTVASFNNHVWTRHCKGQVRPLASTLPQTHHSGGPLPKKVDVPALYRGMQRVGVNLGPSFQIMPDIEVSTASDHLARANTAFRGVEDEADYYIHPTILDVIFQLPIVAAVNGRIRLLKNWIPKTSNGSLSAEGHCVSSDGTTVVEVSGVRLSPADGSISNEIQDTHGAARLQWAPSLEHLSEQDLTRPIEGEKRLCPLAFLQHLSHLHPNLRILEVGLGNGSLLDDIEYHPTSPEGRISFSKFTSTLPHTRDRDGTDFKTHEVEHVALDIEGDLEAQGFGDREFDFIMIRKGSISSGRTETILQNLERIISPAGWVFIEEAPERWKTSLTRAASRQNGYSGYENSFPGRLRTRFTSNSELIIGLTDLQHLTGKTDMHNSAPSYARKVTFLRSDLSIPPTALMKQFECEGYEITQCTLSDRPLPGQDVISLLDEEKPFFEEMTKKQYESLNIFLQMLQDNGLLWITQHSQMSCSDPRYSQTMKPEFEYAIQNRVVHIGRYHPFSLMDQMIVPSLNDRILLDVDIPGRLNTLRWAKVPRERLGPNDVEIEVHAVGLNFKDVTVAMGFIELPTRQLGLEAAGIVTRVGEAVKTMKVGDRVGCMHPHSFSSIIVSPEDLCIRIPDAISFDEAATMLISFATVIHSLVNIARLEQGQSVLIHSACGGVGLAAIQVAKMVGAEIYATGVDVVLNSLSGELLHASWECVAEFGTLIELGRRDLLHGGKLDMRPFIANRNYCCVGLDHLLTKTGIRKRLIDSIFQYYEEGHIKPIHPIRVFEASQVQSAFQTMQKGTHIGRFCISMAVNLVCDAKPRPELPKFEENASFLLVGGTGGIGRALSTFMAENGAQELIFLSRNAGLKSADTDLSTELQSMGCRAIFERGDVCDEAAVSSALLKATRPIKGVVQLSMVLRDQNFSDMTFEQWTEAAAPKIKGTWNLHHATVSRAIDLDFFVLCGSISGHIGQPGQANYASANTFLDSFAQYRNSLGLAASVIDIGAVEDVGVLARNTVSNEPLKDLLAKADEQPAVLKTDEAARILSIEIGKKIADMLLLQPEVDMTATNVLLRDLGMDSLVAVELRAWWRQVFRLDISVREILGMGTLGALGKFAADGLLKART
ncbi:hypothetical protein F5Y10DRAFT_294516 [Nemania abortiva]|nr:hypothetical protein F5Y10DRAFT_294516 [Nemania abortiva]